MNRSVLHGLPLLFFIFVFSATALSMSASRVDLEGLAAGAELIFLGRVLSLESHRDGNGIPATFYTFRVEAAVKPGLRPGEVITIKQFGSVTADLAAGGHFHVPGLPIYLPGERYLLFLTGESRYGFRSPVGLEQGIFIVIEGQVVNGFNNAGLFGSLSSQTALVAAGESLQERKRKGPIPLTVFLSLVAELVGTSLDGDQLAELSEASVSDESTMIPQGNPQIIGNTGEPYVWDVPSATNPAGALAAVPYNSDRGGLGALPNAEAKNLVANAFAVWAAVPTATITFRDAGDLPVDVDGTNFVTYVAESSPDGLNPIIFDSDGSIIDALFGADASCQILGLAGIRWLTTRPPFRAVEGLAILNGLWVDGQSNVGKCGRNTEMSVNQFLGVFVHEFGHYIGLDHTQVNGVAFLEGEDVLGMGVPPLESVATMFPIAMGQDNSTLQLDDKAAVSSLYPTSSFLSGGAISGTVYSSDGVVPFQCANVIARNYNDPFYTAVSNVSGARYIPSGPAWLEGFYEIRGLPAGNYVIQVDQVSSKFTGGSSVGPCDPPRNLPGPEEFYNGLNESNNPVIDNPQDFSLVPVSGSVSGINIILNGPGGPGPGGRPPRLAEGVGPPQDLDSDGLYEDVDGDSGLDIDDAIILARAILILRDPAVLSPANRAFFDFDGDGAVDIDDAIVLARLALGLPALQGSSRAVAGSEQAGMGIRLILEHAPQGLSGYGFEVTLSAGKIEGIELVAFSGISGVEIAPDGRSATFFAVDVNDVVREGATRVELAWIWVSGGAGVKALSVKVTRMFDDSGNVIEAPSIILEPLESVEPRITAIKVYPNPASASADGVRFVVEGQGIEAIDVRIYDLSGRLVYASGFIPGSKLTWDLRDRRGGTLANGIYLYAITARGIGGQLARAKLRKLVILR